MLFGSIGAAVLYFVSFILYIVAICNNSQKLQRISLTFVLIGYILHTVVIAKLMWSSSFLSNGHFYFSLFSWILLLIYFLLILRYKIQFLSLTVAPLALIFLISSMLIGKRIVPFPHIMSSLWFGLHIISLFISISLVCIGFGGAIMYIYINKKIKEKLPLSSIERRTYSLEMLDRINHWVVICAFPLFTIGIISGFVWARISWHHFFSWDLKEIWSIIIWFIFAYLFHQRMAIGWKGKRPAILMIWIFILMVASFTIINLFFPTHHNFRP